MYVFITIFWKYERVNKGILQKMNALGFVIVVVVVVIIVAPQCENCLFALFGTRDTERGAASPWVATS